MFINKTTKWIIFILSIIISVILFILGIKCNNYDAPIAFMLPIFVGLILLFENDKYF